MATNNLAPTSNASSVVNGLESDWQGLLATAFFLGLGGYAIYKLIKW